MVDSEQTGAGGIGPSHTVTGEPELEQVAVTGDIPALRRSEWERAHPTPGGPAERVAGLSRVDLTVDRLTAIARATELGGRLGTKEELRLRCGVSVGTFNEALRLLQSRGLVTVRPGPGGGLFAAEQSPMVRLGNSVLALDADQASVADAVRLRDALDPLLVEDALWHASPADISGMRQDLEEMASAAQDQDAISFIHANWQLHARIAAISPNVMLRSIYTSLLHLIESHTLSVLPVQEQPLPEYLRERHRLHAALVDAIAARDTRTALGLIAEHNTTMSHHHEPAEPNPHADRPVVAAR
jgi:DNA-binding FadR family transcriptional regulator